MHCSLKNSVFVNVCKTEARQSHCNPLAHSTVTLYTLIYGDSYPLWALLMNS